MRRVRASRAARRGRQAVAAGLLLGLFGLGAAVTGSARLEAADLTLNNGVEVTTLDPATITGIAEGRVVRALYEGLTTKDPRTLEPRPGMAERWETSADGRAYTFHLRRGARWTNGDEVTAHDFVWSWERLLHPATAAEYAYQLGYVRGARAYTSMRDELLHSADCWIEPLGGGRARLGVHGFFLADAGGALRDAAGPIAPLPATGERFEAGDTLVRLGDLQAVLPVGGRVVETHVVPGVTGAREWADDPYATALLVVELEAASLDDARRRDAVLDGARARRELFWPRVGIAAPDRYTLVVTLDDPTPYFMDLVSFYALYPVHRASLEAARERWPDRWALEWVRPENIVTNGPFRILERRVNDRIRLVKNEGYWDAENVAMGSIDVLAVEHYGTMLNTYLTGGAGWIDRVPTTLVPRLLPREDFDPQPYLGTYFYRVNVTKPPFDDRRVRRALALTIDRRAICESIMKAGQLPNWGLVPHGMRGYARAEMAHAAVGPRLEGYDAAFARDCAEARELLAAAGFGAGDQPFPTMEIHYNTAETHRDIAEVVADGWRRHLGIDVRLLNQEWKVYLATQSQVEYDVSRSSWIGDYPDPNTFLDIFVGDGENNRTGWANARYDALIEAARSELDREERLRLLAEAEALLMEELPILPIYTYVTQNLRNPRLGGFHENLLDEHFAKYFYWMDDAELAQRRAQRREPAEAVAAPGPSAGLYSPAQERAREAAKADAR